MAGFTPAGGGGATATVLTEGVTSPTVANVALPTANVEVPYALPSNTRRFEIKLRDNAPMKLAYVAGTSGTTYVSLPAGGVYSEDGLSTVTLTLYFQSTAAGSTAEIVSWT